MLEQQFGNFDSFINSQYYPSTIDRINTFTSKSQQLFAEKMQQKERLMNLTHDIVIDLNHRLGSGAYGDVYRGVWKSKNRLVAIKKIKDEHEEASKMMEEEVEIMRQFKHQNVLNFLDIIKHKEGLFLIIQYCQGGNLASEIASQAIPQLNCFYYFKQLIYGMAEVNNLNHIHRDLKPENILFTKYKVLKICDFGLARRIIGEDIEKMERYSAKGSPLYASPQLLNGQAFSGKCDVWSAGLILVEMLTKHCPVYNKAKVRDVQSLRKYQKEVCSKTGHYEFEGNYNKWFKQVVRVMLAYKEQDRATFKQIKQKIEKDEKRIIMELGGFGNAQNPDEQLNVGTTVLTQSIVEVVPQKPDMTYDELQEMNRIEQLANKLQLYLKYLYNRAKVFVDAATKFYQTKSQFNGAVKYIVLYLSIGVYLKAIEYLENLISNTKKCQLPNGDMVGPDIFSKLDGSYLKLLKDEKTKFYTTISSIKDRLSSDKYKNAFPELLKKHVAIISQLEKFEKRQSTLNTEGYQNLYATFFRKEVIDASNKDLSNEEFARLYWLMLKIVSVDKVLPTKEFKNIYIINELIDYSVKTQFTVLLKNIAELKKQEIA